MNIYFSGIGGVGLGPLAELSHDAGHSVQGSDSHVSLETEELKKRGIAISNDQSGGYLEYCHAQLPIDWFVYTAALPENHPELQKARQLGLYTAKRDELLTYIIREKNLRLIAIAGTHGKTTTTAMTVWAMRQLGIPVSYSIGTTVNFGPSGLYDDKSDYFVYECDEFDRNFLHFNPYVSLITSIDYDHPDTYPTQADYANAFSQFLSQSNHAILWHHDTVININVPKNAWVLNDDEIKAFHLPGAQNRANATLVAKLFERLKLGTEDAIKTALDSFPGTQRRFEKLADNLYTDYGHHPVEIAATLQMARELSDHVVLVYQPHQNTRQHQVRNGYTTCAQLAEEIYWLPTYQTREDMNLPQLTPEQLTERLVNRDVVHFADMNDDLWRDITNARQSNRLVLCMGAGTIDGWVRERLRQDIEAQD